MLNWANSDGVFNSVLLCELSSTDKEVVFACYERSIIMSRVYYFVSSLERYIECLTVRSNPFINDNTMLVKFSLESINMLVVGFEVKQTHFVVLAVFN